MEFSLLGDEPALFPKVDRQAEDIQIAPEDVVIGKEIEGDVGLQEATQVALEGKLTYGCGPCEWRGAYTRELTSGPQNCIDISFFEHFRFEIQVFHQKQQELEIIHAATDRYQSELARVPKAVD